MEIASVRQRTPSAWDVEVSVPGFKRPLTLAVYPESESARLCEFTQFSAVFDHIEREEKIADLHRMAIEAVMRRIGGSL